MDLRRTRDRPPPRPVSSTTRSFRTAPCPPGPAQEPRHARERQHLPNDTKRRRPSVIDPTPEAAGRLPGPRAAQNRQIWRFPRPIKDLCHPRQSRRSGRLRIGAKRTTGYLGRDCRPRMKMQSACGFSSAVRTGEAYRMPAAGGHAWRSSGRADLGQSSVAGLVSGSAGRGVVLRHDAGRDAPAVADRDAPVSRPRPDALAALPA